jgi:antirestriction protein ArdC
MFASAEQYYATLFHEMMHATGHATRLRRRGITGKNKFGDEKYSKEELIAEIGAGMLCNYAHIDHKTIDNSASYLASWLEVLANDKQLIFNAYRQAEKAVKYILADRYVHTMAANASVSS